MITSQIRCRFAAIFFVFVVIQFLLLPMQISLGQPILQGRNRVSFEIVSVDTNSKRFVLMPDRDCEIAVFASKVIPGFLGELSDVRAGGLMSIAFGEASTFWYQTPLEHYQTRFWLLLRPASAEPFFYLGESSGRDWSCSWASKLIVATDHVNGPSWVWYEVTLDIARKPGKVLIYLFLPILVLFCLILVPPFCLKVSELTHFLQIYLVTAVFAMTFFIGLRSITPPDLTWIDMTITLEILATTVLMLIEIHEYSLEKMKKAEDTLLSNVRTTRIFWRLIIVASVLTLLLFAI